MPASGQDLAQIRSAAGLPASVPLPGCVVELLVASLRREGDRKLADVIEGVRGKDWTQLSDVQQCELDARIYGVGYMHKGKRVDPRDVTVHRGKQPTIFSHPD